MPSFHQRRFPDIPTVSGGQSILYKMRRALNLFSLKTRLLRPKLCRLCAETAGSRTSLECHFLTQLPIAAIPNPYPSDGPGLNYIVTHDLALPPMNWASSTTRLYSQGAKSKLGECRDFEQHLCGYRVCQRMYRHKWKAYCTTPERKLMEHLVQDKMRSARRPRTVCFCQKRHMEWVNYMSVGGEMGLEAQFYRWIA
ncbi:hypothetical protein B0H14DRAFT_2565761 [Mycena olivaceomarginata]|nr:hypothetical protein B0H14DRAFT_2565761 [Mycena olivaceomarginata]